MTLPVTEPKDGGKKTETDTPPGKGEPGQSQDPPAGTTTEPKGSAGTTTEPKDSEGGKARSFTQEEVNELLGRTRQEGRDRATAGLLKELGIEDVESLKTVVTDAEKKRKEQMTELEQATEEASRLKPFEQQATEQAKVLKSYEKAVGATVESLMKTMEVPDHVKPLLESMPALERLAYLTEHGAAFVKETSKPPATNVANKGGTNSTDASKRIDKARQKYGIR